VNRHVATGIAAAFVAAVAVAIAFSSRHPSAPNAPNAPNADAGRVLAEVTFAHDVAPLVYAKCAPCHHPGGVGPFSLLSYDDVVEHAVEIERVTRTRFMPPWKPVAGWGVFANDRGLAPEQIELLARFNREGRLRGDASAAPRAPTYDEGWQLGVPDLVLELPEPYTLPADGRDVYRNFVIPPAVDGVRVVNGWELRPGTSVVHHAILNVDRLGLARAKDAKDDGPGFGGLDIGDVQSADGLFLVWTPGRVPAPRSRDTAWRIDQRTDLVLQLHLQPSGKSEVIKPKLALYFTTEPPAHRQMTLRIGDPPIDIAPGDAHYVLKSETKLPTDVDVKSVFPHAHYLAKTVRAWAELPDGSEKHLLRIDDWDFAWQDQYVFAAPVRLPSGSMLRMEITYDNSAANPRNPSRPPRRVRSGERSIDEMGNLTFEVVPTAPNGMNLLRLARYRGFVAGDDKSARNHYNLANALSDLGQKDEAIDEYRRAIAIDASLAPAYLNLALLLIARKRPGDEDAALDVLGRASKTKPESADVHVTLGNVLHDRGKTEEALVHFRAATQVDPTSALAHTRLGLAYYEKRDLEHGAAELAEAVRIDPSNWVAHYQLGNVERDSGHRDEAIAHYRRAADLQPSAGEPRAALAALGAPMP